MNKTIDQLRLEYLIEAEKSASSYALEVKIARLEGRKVNLSNVHNIDYNYFGEQLRESIQAEGFTKNQAGYIYGYIYDQHHSCFEDMFGNLQELIELLKKVKS